MLTLHKLFLNDGAASSFDKVIAPTVEQRRKLIDAKNTIRDHLRTDIRAATVTVLGMDRMVSPRFRTQGSWAYKTCVQAAHLPPQEMDWDFGVYLPVTVWQEHNAPPTRLAKLYFDLVENSLNRLCAQKGWTLDSSPTRCVRVKVAPWGHIDVPLYAAPEEKFVEVLEKAVMESAALSSLASLRATAALDESIDAGEMAEAFWELMDEIHLAKRDGTWAASDPEAVAKWFDDQVITHGAQLRRVCCYLKAWRDYQWRDGGGPTSVLIMIVVAQAFQERPRRDDLAVEDAAKALATGLRGDVREMGIDHGKEDFNRMAPAERKDAGDRAQQLADQMYRSRHFGPGLIQTALDNVRSQFGPRIANDRDLVLPDGGGDVRRVPPERVAPPVVGVTKAG